MTTNPKNRFLFRDQVPVGAADVSCDLAEVETRAQMLANLQIEMHKGALEIETFIWSRHSLSTREIRVKGKGFWNVQNLLGQQLTNIFLSPSASNFLSLVKGLRAAL